MAQFNTKNPPWARDPGMAQPGLANLAPQVNLNPLLSQQGVPTSTIYSINNQQSLAQQQYAAQQISVAALQANPGGPPPTMQQGVPLPQPGIAIPTTLATTQVATISYPAPRVQNPGNVPPPKQQRVFTGNVTKLHDNFGFVDEDVFFQTSCVKGVIPKVGDRVLVEASYNANMPFKWNAARIQVLPNQPSVQPTGQHPFTQQQNNYNQPLQSNFSQPQPQITFTQQLPQPPTFSQQPPQFTQAAPIAYQVKGVIGSGITPSVLPPSTMTQPPPLMGQPTQPAGSTKRDKGLIQPTQSGRSNFIQPRRMENRPYREPERSRDRDRSDRHAHDRRERRSPRKRSRSPRRSKSPTVRSRSPQRRHKPTRVVPRYMVQIPKLSLETEDSNVITLKSRYSSLYVPSDFFHVKFAWTDCFPLHRPIHLGNSCSFHIMSKDVSPVNKFDTILEPSDVNHLYSAKVMLLSMPPMDEVYQKSCALSEDPQEIRETFQHPTRLVQFLVGMKGKSEPMAIGGPWSPSLDGANPAEDPRVLINTAIRTTRSLTGIDLSRCTQWYRFTEIRYHRPEELHKGRLVPSRVETVVIFLPDVWSCHPTHLEWTQLQAAYKQQLQDKLAEDAKEDTQEEEEEGQDGAADGENDPTYYAELDPKSMKVADLRKELEARLLSSKGLKSQLIARLTKSLKTEQEKEEQDAENKEEQEENKAEEEKKNDNEEKDEAQKLKDDDEKKKKEEKDRQIREKKYQIPDGPTILVHPSATAKGGKFDCSVTSLSVLLDYRLEDNKEHSFEVSLFAELFNEMLMRDFGFHIYKALLTTPEPKKDEDKKESKDKDVKENNKDGEDKETGKSEELSELFEPTVKKRKISEDSDDKEKDKNDKREDIDRNMASQDGDNDEDDEDDLKDKDSDRHHGRDKEKKKDKLKQTTIKRDLLLAFVYFDQSHTGYLMDKDVEEIIHTLGLQLSRSQVKKLVQKFLQKDSLHYRKLTDRSLQEKDGERMDDDTPEPIEESGEKLDNLTLAQGNLPHLDLYKHGANIGECDGELRNTRLSQKSDGSSDGMVMYNGAMVDINSVMQSLERSEKTRVTVEANYKELFDEMEVLKTNFTSSEETSQKVALELTELKKKLREQKKHSEASDATIRKMIEILSKSKGALSAVLCDLQDITEEIDDKSEVKLKIESLNGE